jgi:uncharacterized membrane protein YphA (DoxX/SURF4 family)
MDFLLTLHSLVRWIVVVLAVVSLVAFALVWMNRLQASKRIWALMSAFTGMIDLQVLIGLIYLIATWGAVSGSKQIIGYRMEHAVTMVVAAVVAHLSMRWRKSGDTVRARSNVIIIIVTLLIVFIGVARLPGGWAR